MKESKVKTEKVTYKCPNTKKYSSELLPENNTGKLDSKVNKKTHQKPNN